MKKIASRKIRFILTVACLAGLSGSLLSEPPENGTGGRTGGLVDEIVVVREPESARALRRIQEGELHVYAQGITDPELYRQVQGSDRIAHDLSYGSSAELAFNPVGPTFPATGKLNPFHVPAIREGMNRLIDRRHIAQEIYGGLAKPRFFPISTVFPDYARLADVARRLELEYGHDPEAAEATITREMERLGASRNGQGRWTYQGEPVRIAIVIRIEDERKSIGDYVANLLHGIGFEVDRLYKNAREASRIWLSGDPEEGQWHIYTGGWISTSIQRDQSGSFDFYYTPRGRAESLWQAYTPGPELDEVSGRLQRRDFRTMKERQELMARAMELSLEDSVRVWLVDQLNVWPRSPDVEVAADLAGGMSGSALWPYTVRYRNRTGGRLTLGVSNVLTEPWNPVDGTNWIFDTMIIRALGDDTALIPDPYTGLHRPQQIESAEVVVEEGLPVIRTHDWLTLETASSIEVPEDAWIDWDPAAERFVTVAEKHPDGITARTKTTVRYQDGILDRLWHDGSRFSAADIVMGWILTFDRAKEESPLYDEAYAPLFESFQEYFRGWRIVSRDPLTIEIYSDQIYLDAEMIVYAGASSFDTPWHTLGLGIRADRARELSFSSHKANKYETEWMSLVAGPSLPILKRHLETSRSEGGLPFAEALAPFLREGEVAERYRNLAAWHEERGHFWVGSGPYFLAAVHPVEGNVVLRRFAEFPDPGDRWLGFANPRFPAVAIAGPEMVEGGEPATFEVRVTEGGDPYPADDIEGVRYLLFDGRRRLVGQGAAEAAGDGTWRVVLSAERVAGLEAGSNRLEIVVVSRAVAMPVFESFSFLSIP